MKSIFNLRLIRIAAYLVIVSCIIYAIVLMFTLYEIIYSTEYRELISETIPIWYSMFIWIYEVVMMILLGMSGYLMLRLINVIDRKGILIEDVGRRINQIILFFGGIYALNIIFESIVNYQNHSGFSLAFFAELGYLVFFVGAFYLLTRVLLEAIRLKAENDLTI